jgi:hypothetical protein
MFESHPLDLLLPDGTRRSVILTVYYPDEEDEPYEVALDLNDEQVNGSSDRGVFFALQDLRRKLDTRHVLTDCYGGSENVYPSGMAENMGDVVKAYRLTLGGQTALTDLVDIFERGSDTRPSTVEAQERFFGEWCSHFVARSKA